MTLPLISICIPAYNVQNYITETIRSVIAQDYKNIQVVIVDDGSADGTVKTIEALKYARIKIIKTGNGGAARARNLAYMHSQGDYVIFLDADDLISPNFVSSQFDAIKNNADSIAVSAWGRFYKSPDVDFKLSKELIEHTHTFDEWITTNWYQNQHNTPPGRILISRNIIEKAGLWNEELSLNDDFEFFTRIAICAEKIIPNPGAIYYYRSGINGLSAQKGQDAYFSLFRSMQLSFDAVTREYKGNKNIEQACANLWQSFIYEVYPLLKNERAIALKKIKQFGGSDLPFPAGGFTRIMVKTIGWKTARHIKLLLKK